jgi:hypothetical protein
VGVDQYLIIWSNSGKQLYEKSAFWVSVEATGKPSHDISQQRHQRLDESMRTHFRQG